MCNLAQFNYEILLGFKGCMLEVRGKNSEGSIMLLDFVS